MPSYYYKARDTSGRAHEGIEVAASEEEVLRILESSKLTPVFIEARAPGGARAARDAFPVLRTWQRAWERVQNGIQPGSVALFARQLATMIGAGLPLVRSLRSIARDHHDRRLAAILDRVAEDVQKGESLSGALGRHPAAFDEVFVSLVHTGEVSGTLDTIMDQTAAYLERAETLRVKVEAALRYPSFILIFSVSVLAVMVLWIIPMFSGIYERFRVPLPLPTQTLLDLSRVVTGNLPVVAVLLAFGALAAWNAAQTEQGRLLWDRWKLNMPVFGPLIRMYAVTKLARTLGILTMSGTQILYALRVMKPVPGNLVLEKGLEQIRSRVEQGTSLSRAMSESGVLPEMLVQMTATGEETGQLDNMLGRTADFYEQRVTASVDGLSSLIEPFAIIIVGLVVGAMLLALYLPVFSLGQAMRSGLLGQ